MCRLGGDQDRRSWFWGRSTRHAGSQSLGSSPARGRRPVSARGSAQAGIGRQGGRCRRVPRRGRVGRPRRWGDLAECRPDLSVRNGTIDEAGGQRPSSTAQERAEQGRRRWVAEPPLHELDTIAEVVQGEGPTERRAARQNWKASRSPVVAAVVAQQAQDPAGLSMAIDAATGAGRSHQVTARTARRSELCLGKRAPARTSRVLKTAVGSWHLDGIRRMLSVQTRASAKRSACGAVEP